MIAEVGADEAAVPRPVVLRVRRRVDADPAATRVDVALERRLLDVVEHVARREQEDDGAVAREVRVAEGATVLRRIDVEAVSCAECRDRLHGSRDRGVAEPGRLREDEDLRHGYRGRHRARSKDAETEREHERPLHPTIVPGWSHFSQSE